MNRYLKIKSLTLSAILCVLISSAAWAGPNDDTIFRAMSDELGRSMGELVLPGFDHPYFISYTIDDYQELAITGQLGTLIDSNLRRGRYLTVDLRVGSYNLDNSNFISGFYGRDPNYFQAAIDYDYDALRNEIYLATDRIYKNALKDYSKKEAYLQSRVMENRPDDFLKQPANTYMGQAEAFDINKGYFDNVAQAASVVFRAYPLIISSEIDITVGINNQYLVNSEGSRSLRGNRLYTIEIAMSGKSSDGEDISDGDKIIAKTLADLPGRDSLIAWAKSNAERMNSLLSASAIDEYTGPVIFEGSAAGEFFRQVLARNVSESPAPIYENERMGQRADGPEFGNKVKRRIAPEFINVFDDPTIDKYNGLKLVGDYKVDDAGNAPQKVQLVEQGKLVNLLIGVAPTKQVKEPNGHARGAVSKDIAARPGNMIIESTEKVPIAKLRKQMLEYCRDMDLEYGLIIRRLDDPNNPYSPDAANGAGSNELSAPLEVYKLYLNGQEELVRNCEFNDVTVRVLKDIVMTGDKPQVYNYLIGNDYEMPVSIVCPSVLIEEMDIKKTEAKIKKPPVLPSPLAEQMR